MPAARISMRKFKESMRVKIQGQLTHRQIARSLGIGAGTVSRYVRELQGAGLSWPLPAELSDADIERRLFPEPAVRPRATKAAPDFAAMHQELKRKGVTKALLWEEYREQAGPERAYRIRSTIPVLPDSAFVINGDVLASRGGHDVERFRTH